MAVKKGLGKGLSALFGETMEAYDNVYETEEREEKKEGTSLNQLKTTTPDEPKNLSPLEVDIEKVYPNPDQPRKIFNNEALEELANSIKIHGVISPLVVVETPKGYMIIAGERRYRASKLAKRETVPVIIRKSSPREIRELALIENLQREDLNPMEAARGIKELMDSCKLTQESVADRIGKSRSNVANLLRLLSLSAPVAELIYQGRLSYGHARSLVVVNDPDEQLKLAYNACDNKMSVRDLEKAVQEFLYPIKKEKKDKTEQSEELKDLVQQFQRVFATKVSAVGNDSKGRIYIDYFTRDDLDRFLAIAAILKKNVK